MEASSSNFMLSTKGGGAITSVVELKNCATRSFSGGAKGSGVGGS